MSDEETLREALIDLARAREQEERLRLEADGLLDGLRVLIEPGETAAMFGRLLDVMRGLLKFEQACVLIGQADGSLHPISSTTPAFDATVWWPGRLFQRVFAGKPVAVFDVRMIEEWKAQPPQVVVDVCSALHAPLRGGDSPAILVCTHSKKAFFNNEHVHLASRFAPLAAQALLNVEASEMAFRQRLLEEEKLAMQERSELLSAARDEAIAASRMKSDFLANMSHEIRTPMNAIIGLSHLALQGTLGAQERDYIDKTNRAARSLLGLIDDILDFSKVEAGRLELEHAPFGLRELFDDLIGIVGLRAQEKGLELVLDIDPDIPPCLIGDSYRIKQILLNLVNNAIKFTVQGKIVVSARREPRPDGARLTLQVRDTGLGIDHAHQERIFDSFTQADPSTTRLHGGTGLGLAICRRLAELMSGTIGVDSAPGEGSTFTVVLPLEEADGAALEDTQGAASLDAAMHAVRGARLLLVEDNELNQEVAIGLLRARGVDVDLAGDGREGLRMLLENRYDGVLMDCQMPVMDGYDATRELRRLPGYRELPVIAMTANVLREDVERALEAGMNDLIPKPLDVGNMFITLARWVRPARAVGAALAPAVVQAGPARVSVPTGVPGLDIEAGLARVGGDQDIYGRMLHKFSKGECDAVADALRALEAGDMEAARRRMHTLKGTAGSVGAARLSALAAEVEHGLAEGRGDIDFAAAGQALQDLCAALAAFRWKMKPTDVAGAAGVDRSALLESLRGQLLDCNTAAAETVERLIAGMHGDDDLVSAYLEVREAVGRYDFDAASELLEAAAPPPA